MIDWSEVDILLDDVLPTRQRIIPKIDQDYLDSRKTSAVNYFVGGFYTVSEQKNKARKPRKKKEKVVKKRKRIIGLIGNQHPLQLYFNSLLRTFKPQPL